MTLGFDEEKLKVRVKLLDGREISFGGRRVDKLPSAARQISSELLVRIVLGRPGTSPRVSRFKINEWES